MPDLDIASDPGWQTPLNWQSTAPKDMPASDTGNDISQLGKLDLDAMLTVLAKSASSGMKIGPQGSKSGSMAFDPPMLDAPADFTPEQQEAMVNALISAASKEVIDISGKIITMNNKQRQEYNRQIEEATKTARDQQARAEELAGKRSVADWIKSIGMLVVAATFTVLAAVGTGGLAVAGAAITFGMAVAEFVNTCIKHAPAPTNPDGSEKQRIDFSIGGLMAVIVEQVAKDNPGFYKSEDEKKEAIKNWTIGVTVALTLTAVAMGFGATGLAMKGAAEGATTAANAAVKVQTASATAHLMGTKLQVGAKVTAGLSEIAAGSAAVVEGMAQRDMAVVNEEVELARAQRVYLTTLLTGLNMNTQVFFEAFKQAVQTRDRCIRDTSDSIARADRTWQAVLRNYS
ncbi:MAG: hypothetical protein ACRYGK_12725 [Janthinobacterium lividum]